MRIGESITGLFKLGDLFVEGVFAARTAVFGQLDFFGGVELTLFGDVVKAAADRAFET